MSRRPSNQITITLSLFLSFHVMAPVWQKIEAESVRPYYNREIQRFGKAVNPKSFLGHLIRGTKIRSVREKNVRNMYIRGEMKMLRLKTGAELTIRSI
ncbi:MAG TPA: hypothetical protein VGK77_09645 [Candidatus Binatia bacterium]